jgi:hypothetical protein
VSGIPVGGPIFFFFFLLLLLLYSLTLEDVTNR